VFAVKILLILLTFSCPLAVLNESNTPLEHDVNECLVSGVWHAPYEQQFVMNGTVCWWPVAKQKFSTQDIYSFFLPQTKHLPSRPIPVQHIHCTCNYSF
jgi:hypothetical protein